MAVNENGGVKYNEGKPKMSDMFKGFWESLIAVSEVYNFGAKKHGMENWKNVYEHDYIDAAFRHLQEVNKGNDISLEKDLEGNKHEFYHAAQLAWNGLVLCWFAIQRRIKQSIGIRQEEYFPYKAGSTIEMCCDTCANFIHKTCIARGCINNELWHFKYYKK